MRWLKRFFAGLFAMLVLAGVAVYLIPLDAYVPNVEQALSERLQEQVHIRHIRVAGLPLPHLELREVRLGGKEGMTARTVSVEPDLPGLLMGRLAVRRILLEEGVASFAQVRKLAGLFGKPPVTGRRVAVRELHLSGMNLVMPDLTLGPIEGKLEFAPAGRLERIWLAMNKQKITAVLLPLPGQHFSVKVQARAWTPPKLPQLLLDELQVEGVLGNQDLVANKFAVALHGIRASGSGRVEFSDGWSVTANLAQVEAPLERLMILLGKQVDLTGQASAKGELKGKAAKLAGLKDSFGFSGDVLIRHAAARIAADIPRPLIFDQIRAHVVIDPEILKLNALEAKLYGGKLSGTASVNRRNTVLTADVAATGIAMQPLVEALTNEVLFTGSMESAAKFSMRLDAFERFPENLFLTGNFHLRKGVLTKVDLEQVANDPDKSNARGGTTQFDDLTGLIGVDAGGYHFRELKIASGSLNAEGRVDVSPALQLRGKLDVKVKRTAGLVSMPMVVSGTLDKPIVRISKAAWAGAAIGTAILGPGLGTALGVRIGGFLNKLFGKDDANNGVHDLPETPPVKK